MANINALVMMGMLFVMLIGCASQAETIPESGLSLPETSKTEESVNLDGEKSFDPNDMEAAAETKGDTVTLLVYGGWNYVEDVRNEDDVYVLEGEQAEIIVDLFYNHEKEIMETPMDSAATLEFRIGEDFLCTSMEALRTLSGIINGELVLVELSDSEYEAIHQIILQYAQNVPE